MRLSNYELTTYVLEHAKACDLKRQKSNGHIYRRVHDLSYVYEPWKTPKEYINYLFQGHSL